MITPVYTCAPTHPHAACFTCVPRVPPRLPGHARPDTPGLACSSQQNPACMQFLLAQRLDTTVRALLTPESLWPEEAQEAGLQHVVLSWPTSRLLLDTAFAVRFPSDPPPPSLLPPRPLPC